MERAKISVIGAGNVGGSIAHHCAEDQLGDVVVLDLPQTETMPQGKALDLLQTGPISATSTPGSVARTTMRIRPAATW